MKPPVIKVDITGDYRIVLPAMREVPTKIAEACFGDALCIMDSVVEDGVYDVASGADLVIIYNREAYSFVRLCSYCYERVPQDQPVKVFVIGDEDYLDDGGELMRRVSFCSEECERKYFSELSRKTGFPIAASYWIDYSLDDVVKVIG